MKCTFNDRDSTDRARAMTMLKPLSHITLDVQALALGSQEPILFIGKSMKT